MTESGDDAATRRTEMAKTIVAHRKAGSDSPVVFGAAGSDATVQYLDREVTVLVSDRAQSLLDELLAEFPVFKVAQPATRKAPDGEVHISALADPKHTADFLDQLFLSVYDQPDDYTLTVET